MRLHIRSVVAVAFLLVLFIVFVYLSSHLSKEATIRMKRNQEKASKKHINPVEKRHFVDQAYDRPKVHISRGVPETTKQRIGPQYPAERHDHHVGPLSSPAVKQIDGSRPEQTTKSFREIFKKYSPFQPVEEVEFPAKEGDGPRIPHILHQIYTSLNVIANYSDFIMTFITHNPKWEYRFWSYESGRVLIADRHPYLLPTFDNVSALSVKKSDMIKYAALYEFGGVYSDLDMKNYRSLDIVTMKYACIIPPEPFEHAESLFKSELLLNSGILLCRPKHPFFEALLKNLHGVAPSSNPVETTGSKYITGQYLKYNNLTEDSLNRPKTDNGSNTPFFYKGTRDEEDDDAIYIPNTQYFNDKVDQMIMNDKSHSCQNILALTQPVSLVLLKRRTIRGCIELETRKLVRARKKYAFTEHCWHHLWKMSYPWIQSLRTRHIKDIVPHVALYNKDF